MGINRNGWNHVYIMYALTFVVILPIVFRNSPFSIYFIGWSKEKLMEKATNANELRFREATRYMNGLNAVKSKAFYGALQQQEAVDLTVAVVTVKRSDGKHTLGYLTQVVTELDKIFKTDVNFKKVMFICNTFAGPGQHDEADRLARYFPVETRFPRGNVEHANIDVFEKEKRDYIYCLQKALQYPTKHVMLIEDDTVPRHDMLDVLNYILKTRVMRLYKSDELVARNWAYVKLFYPDRWLGYSRNILHIVELLSIGVVGGTLYLLATLLFVRNHDMSPLRKKYKTFLCVALYCILVAIAIGRQNVHAVQRLSAFFYSVWQAPDCCSPAILFNAESAIEISSYLAGTQNNSKLTFHREVDLAMSEFAQARDFNTLLVQPNLVRHIGLISSLKRVTTVPEHFAFLS